MKVDVYGLGYINEVSGTRDGSDGAWSFLRRLDSRGGVLSVYGGGGRYSQQPKCIGFRFRHAA